MFIATEHAERIEAHRAKMADKAACRERWYRNWPRPPVAANLSKRHPDHGCTMAEHLRRKAARAEQSA